MSKTKNKGSFLSHTKIWYFCPILIRSFFQCDETHPICKNCIKSKRDCLGYDPVFKAQTGQQNLQSAGPVTEPNVSSSSAQASSTTSPTNRPYSRSPPNMPHSSITQQPPSVLDQSLSGSHSSTSIALPIPHSMSMSHSFQSRYDRTPQGATC
jgi:white-opaque regulator 2